MKLRVGRYEFSPQLPRVGRRRAVTICLLAATFTALWFWAAFQGLAGIRPCWQIVVGGVAIPWGWAWSMLMWAEYRIVRELVPAERRPLPEHDRDRYEFIEVRPDRADAR